jgi:ribosomal protein S18 acetylase RimI-like enzyme
LRRGSRESAATPTVALRPAALADMLECAHVWSDSIEDYVRRLNQPWFAGDLEPLRRLLAHCLTTDPERFVVAVAGDAPDRIVGFGEATVRGDVWFLGMLFVLPKFQGAGVGRRLLEAILPAGEPVRLATATDSVQPISNALYPKYGMVPRLPLFNFVGRPDRPEAFGELPSGVTIVEGVAETAERDDADIAAIDEAILGHARPADHAFLVSERRCRFLARSDQGDALGYGYIAPSGRFGPVAAVDPALLAPLVGQLVTSVRAPGAYASWIPGAAEDLFVALLRAGFRLESFPALFLWDRPIGDFSRYVPINLALI